MKVSIVGGSGYVGGETLRLLLHHPKVEVAQVTSEQYAGRYVHIVHPNLRGRTRLQFVRLDDIKQCDLLFLGLPHGKAAKKIESFCQTAPKIIDLSADFRLKNPDDYKTYYGMDEHPNPEFLKKFVYGIPELHREEIAKADFVTGAGCLAAAAILGLYPLMRNRLIEPDQIFIEGKTGSSAGGNKPALDSHHPERSNVLRSYAPTGHRHTAEMIQELTFNNVVPSINFSATSVELVRGILATSHCVLKEDLTEKELWHAYREAYSDEPFMRIVKERRGIYRYPEPKILSGSNYCDVGFEKHARSKWVVVMSAIDNLMKGAAGMGVQSMNVMMGWSETTGLEFPGMHPI